MYPTLWLLKELECPLWQTYALWHTHITKMTKKAFGVLMFINRIKELFSSKVWKIVIQTLVLSIVNYGMTVRGTTNKSQLKRVQKLYNFSAVAVRGRSRYSYDHASPILEELKWLNVSKRIQYERCILMHNLISNKYPNWPFNIPTVSQTTHRNTKATRQFLYTQN